MLEYKDTDTNKGISDKNLNYDSFRMMAKIAVKRTSSNKLVTYVFMHYLREST